MAESQNVQSHHAGNEETGRHTDAGCAGGGRRLTSVGRFALRQSVDFHVVDARHEVIHARLLNWARWCNGKPDSNVTPMFRAYRSTDVWAAPEIGQPVDKLDAARIAKAVVALPGNHRAATQWHYVKPISPGRAARTLGVTLADLAQLVVDARTMLINRRA